MNLAARSVSVTRGAATLVRDLSLEVEGGTFLGLLGPNGAGKTSLMRVLAGLEAPASGHVLYDGRDAAEIGRRGLGRTIAYLPQDGRLLAEGTPTEVLDDAYLADAFGVDAVRLTHAGETVVLPWARRE